ncbi:838_t:CDS:1, partial [Scutellospora calospora]
YNHLLIIAFATVKKLHKIKSKNRDEYIIHEGNFNKSSCQMEYAILIAIIETIALILNATE